MSDLENDISSLVDRSVKILFRHQPHALLRLAGIPSAVAVRFEDPSLNLPELRADHVFVIAEERPADAYAIYVEYQLKPEPHKHPLWCLKWGALCRQLSMPVVLLVIYLERGKRATFPAAHRVTGGPLRTTLSFDTIRLWEHRDRIVNGDWPELAPLLVLCEPRPTEQTIQQEKALIRGSGLPSEVQAELMEVALLVASRRFSRAVLSALFAEELDRMTTLDDLKELFYEAGSFRHWLQDPRIGEQLREIAKAEGKAEGLAEGEAETTRRMTLALLTRRFGELPEAIVQRIQTADAAWCQDLFDRALTASSLSELIALT